LDTGKAQPIKGYELRPAIKIFAEAMEGVLRENEYKGGWGETQCDIPYLERRLHEELTEYSVAKDYGATGSVPEKELVDVANFCMMLYHRLLNNQNCLG